MSIFCCLQSSRTKNAFDYYKSGKKYPVLWLLHGTYGDYTDYVRRTNIDLYAKENEIIVVMPSGMNAEYSKELCKNKFTNST